MPENPTVIPPSNPPVTGPAADTPVETKVEEDDDEKEIIETSFDGNTKVNLELFTKKKRGKNETLSIARPVFDLDPSKQDVIKAEWDKVKKLAEWIGLPNFLGMLVREVFNPISLEASEAGFTTDGFSPIKFWDSVKKYCDPRERRKSGPTLKEINESLVSLATEIMAFIVKFQKGEKLTEAELNKAASIKIEHSRLSELKAKKERRGKPTEAKAAPATGTTGTTGTPVAPTPTTSGTPVKPVR